MPYLLTALIAFLAAAGLVPAVRWLACRFGAVDQPDAERRWHGRPVPLWGGVAVFLALALTLTVAGQAGWLPGEHIRLKYLWGLGMAGFLLAFGGVLDDRFRLKPWQQVVWPILAAVVVIASGIGVKYITNPLGGQIHLDSLSWTVVWWEGLPYRLTLLADIFSFVWLMGMTYTTKFLDGIDGLVAGVTVIGCLVIAAVSQMVDVRQPDTAILAMAGAGAFAGFLVFNFSPAKIFLGEGGATLAGFFLGALAIVSGGKIATALLILGLPIFDAVAVIFRRIRQGQPVWRGDRSHLHFRLVDMGLSQRQAVLFYWFSAAAFGVSTLVLRGWEKLAALGLIVSLTAAFLAGASLIRGKRHL
ncbi:undecaprenyl/decaprenyl-phosphate alpha-N-acetylglucosaminyl 1-phosphate transferase [Candidatus Uhrbacteria bacterium]|nr:undecaprenyl/decaprenyl-phosphate alpha-N-acetylglucosaminyl 1-phosphate transferase [Candidatus Uhrbacteria bacterium]